MANLLSTSGLKSPVVAANQKVYRSHRCMKDVLGHSREKVFDTAQIWDPFNFSYCIDTEGFKLMVLPICISNFEGV